MRLQSTPRLPPMNWRSCNNFIVLEHGWHSFECERGSIDDDRCLEAQHQARECITHFFWLTSTSLTAILMDSSFSNLSLYLLTVQLFCTIVAGSCSTYKTAYKCDQELICGALELFIKECTAPVLRSRAQWYRAGACQLNLSTTTQNTLRQPPACPNDPFLSQASVVVYVSSRAL